MEQLIVLSSLHDNNMALRDLLTSALSLGRDRMNQNRQGLSLAGLQSAQRQLPDGQSYDTVTTTQGAQPVVEKPQSSRLVRGAMGAIGDAIGGPVLPRMMQATSGLYGRFNNQRQPAPQPEVAPQPQPEIPMEPQMDYNNIDPFAGGVSYNMGGSFGGGQQMGGVPMGGGMDFSNITAADLPNLSPEQLFNLRQSLAYDAGAQMVGDKSTPIDQLYSRANALAGISDNAGRTLGQYQQLENTVGNIYQPQIDRIDNLLDSKTSQSSGGGYSGGEYEGVINNLLATGKYTKSQADYIRTAVATGQNPRNVILEVAKSNLQSEDKKLLQNSESALNEMNNVKKLLDQYYELGGDTGLLKGNYEKVLNRLGRTTDPELARVGSELVQTIMKFRNATTGTAASIQEDRRIDSIFPGIDKGQALNNALTTGRLSSLQSDVDRLYGNVLGSYYNTLKTGGNQSMSGQQSQPQMGGQVIQTSVGAINTNW